MKKEVYLVLCCPKKEFREFSKKGYKLNLMMYKCYCSPVWATASKAEAIGDCVNHNKMKFDECIYFMRPIQLFK